MCIKVEEFDISRDIFNLKLGKRECYKVDTGICLVEDLIVDQILNLEGKRYYRFSETYCPILAKQILERGVVRELWLSFNGCGHYSITDGRHRICVAQKLRTKGYKISAPVMIGRGAGCYKCRINYNLKNY